MVSIHFPWRMNFALLKWITTKGGCVFCSIQVVLVDRLQFQIETKSFRWVRVDEWYQRMNLLISIVQKNISSEFQRYSWWFSFMVSLGRIFHVWKFTFLVPYLRFHQLIHALVTCHWIIFICGNKYQSIKWFVLAEMLQHQTIVNSASTWHRGEYSSSRKENEKLIYVMKL